MTTTVNFTLNGSAKSVSVSDSGIPLLWALRDILGLTGTKYGCGVEICGACMVLVNGQAHKSCDMDFGSVAGKSVITVEGLSADPDGQKAQAAWVSCQVPQCGWCQSGFLIATVGAMKSGQHGSAIASQVSNICVCGTQPRIAAAMSTL